MFWLLRVAKKVKARAEKKAAKRKAREEAQEAAQKELAGLQRGDRQAKRAINIGTRVTREHASRYRVDTARTA